MKANELRIGNLVNYTTAEGDVLTNVIDWQDLKWLSEDEQGFNLVHDPISLTEEWLLRFGFKEFLIDETWYFIKNDFVFEISGIIGFHNYNELESICFNENKCKYVHQLQNLYFALTGEELSL